jgi:hypothetical protein
MPGVWVWSISPQISAVQSGNALNIYVRFPAASPHYLYIRSVRPFANIQMRGVDYRSDPQLEHYNSPGWVYSAAEQTLSIKMVNRSEAELIRIVF